MDRNLVRIHKLGNTMHFSSIQSHNKHPPSIQIHHLPINPSPKAKLHITNQISHQISATNRVLHHNSSNSTTLKRSYLHEPIHIIITNTHKPCPQPQNPTSPPSPPSSLSVSPTQLSSRAKKAQRLTARERGGKINMLVLDES